MRSACSTREMSGIGLTLPRSDVRERPAVGDANLSEASEPSWRVPRDISLAVSVTSRRRAGPSAEFPKKRSPGAESSRITYFGNRQIRRREKKPCGPDLALLKELGRDHACRRAKRL